MHGDWLFKNSEKTAYFNNRCYVWTEVYTKGDSNVISS